jgi:hypothetical protein
MLGDTVRRLTMTWKTVCQLVYNDIIEGGSKDQGLSRPSQTPSKAYWRLCLEEVMYAVVAFAPRCCRPRPPWLTVRVEMREE